MRFATAATTTVMAKPMKVYSMPVVPAAHCRLKHVTDVMTIAMDESMKMPNVHQGTSVFRPNAFCRVGLVNARQVRLA